MSNKIQEIFFSLLRVGLSGEKGCSLVMYGQITDDTWQGVYDMAQEQGLTGVVFSGVEKLPKAQLPGMDLLMDWLGQVEYIKSCNEEYRRNVGEFMDLMTAEGYTSVVLKGMTCASWYPDPDRRSLGDLDVYLVNGAKGLEGHYEAYERCNELVQKMGVPFEVHDYKHAHITWKGVSVENHRNLTEFRGFAERKKAERYMQEMLCKEGVASAQFNALFLTFHAFLHFINEGISVRHACDWAMFMKQNQQDVNWDEFYEWTNRLGMSRFADAMTMIAHDYLGVLAAREPRAKGSKECADMLIADMLHGQRKLNGKDPDLVYAWKKTLNFFKFSWKFKTVYERNVLWYYLKFCWGYFTDKEPSIL